MRRVALGRAKPGSVRDGLQGVSTLGAEFGVRGHLASTIDTGSCQLSSTFLAELRLSSVFVLALRAFHRRARRKKRARCTNRLTSRVISNKAHVYPTGIIRKGPGPRAEHKTGMPLPPRRTSRPETRAR